MKKGTAIQLDVMRGFTDVIYKGLFSMTTWELLKHFRLDVRHLFDNEDNELRDRMGILALKALAEVESELVGRFQWVEKMPERWIEITTEVAQETAIRYKALAEKEGVDFLTGNKRSAP